MTFNIGSQTGGVISNVGRDQVVTGGQHGTAVTQADARSALEALRALLHRPEATPLTEEEQAAVEADLTAIDADLAEPDPPRERIGERLTRLTTVLSQAGALLGAGAALVGPLSTLAQWLGSAGVAVLQLLPV
jgi:hypothetical protein